MPPIRDSFTRGDRPDTGGPDPRNDDWTGLTSVVQQIAPVGPDASAQYAYDRFSADAALYVLPVTDAAGRPVGLINRFSFLEALSRPFGRDLIAHRAVRAVMDPAPLIVDEAMPVEKLSDILADERTRYIFDGFIVTRDGRYAGVGTGYSLMRRLAEREQAVLFHLAHHDPLTGLANRHLFDDRLTQALAKAERHGRHVGVLFIDVDRFKAVNDNFGHVVGDLLLQAIGARLIGAARAEDTVARLSGDEFAVVLSELHAPSDGERVARKLLEILASPHALEAHDINVSCSIGVAVFPDDATASAALVRAADDAVYRAKQYRNTWQRYGPEMRRSDTPSFHVLTSIRRVLDERRIEVHYQPQLVCGARTICAVEALVRARDAEGAALSPALFVRLAEDAGLIASITDAVMATAMRQVLEWQRRGVAPDLRLAINVSGLELRDGALLPMLARHLSETGFPPALLELEITESTVMHSAATTVGVLTTLQDLGVRLLIDDFGTGYSSLSRLQRLPVTGLKIDQSFVQEIDQEGSGALTAGIIGMAHALKLDVTAEGVETDRQLAFLETHGCDRVQGYLFSRPLPSVEMGAYLRARRPTA